MKTIIVAIASTFFCISIFAQDEKPCQFIGRYDKVKKGICSEQAIVNEPILDYNEYILKRKQFDEEHKTENSYTYFIAADQAVIAYKYEKEMAGWHCNSTLISIKTGKTIEDCNRKLAEQVAKSPKYFTTQPNTIFTWQGKGLPPAATRVPTTSTKLKEYSKDYGGLKAKFTSGSTPSKDIIVAQFTNYTKDKRAIVFIQNGGVDTVQYISPGSTLNLNYKTKKLEIQVKYEDDKSPKPGRGIMNSIKDEVYDILTNENGEIKLKKWDPACMCVRG